MLKKSFIGFGIDKFESISLSCLLELIESMSKESSLGKFCFNISGKSCFDLFRFPCLTI